MPESNIKRCFIGDVEIDIKPDCIEPTIVIDDDGTLEKQMERRIRSFSFQHTVVFKNRKQKKHLRKLFKTTNKEKRAIQSLRDRIKNGTLNYD